MLSQKQLNNFCLLGDSNRHKTCRYLYRDDMDPRKWYCCKLHASKKTAIDVAITTLIADCKKAGTNPKSRGVAMGNNCPGFPILKHVVQGQE